MSATGLAKEAEPRMTTEDNTQLYREPQEQPAKSRLFMVASRSLYALWVGTSGALGG